MKVLIIPEDFRKDQYLLKPIMEAIFSHYGKPHAKIIVCNPPLLQGVTEALKSTRLQEVVDRYRFVDLIILCVDRDGVQGRKYRLGQIEAEFQAIKPFLAENAWEELETWTLAGLPLPKEWAWNDVRSAISVKEMFFEPLAEMLEVSDGPGGGRKHLGAQAAKNVQLLLAKCPEDLGLLASRIEQFLN